MEQEQTLDTTAQEVYLLDDAAIETLAAYEQQEMALNAARNAVLNYFLRQHKLEGKWQLAPNRKELVKAP